MMSINIKLCLICVILAVGTMAQTPVQTRIIGSGNILPAPSFSYDATKMLIKQFGEAGYQRILRNSHESNWPKGLGDGNSRYAYREDFGNYTAYLIADISPGLLLLYLPAAENGHMPAAIRPVEDIFFVIYKEGVLRGQLLTPDLNASNSSLKANHGGMSTKVGEHTSKDSTQGETLFVQKFVADFKALVADFATNFAKSKGIPQENAMSEIMPSYKEYACKLPLEGTFNRYFSTLAGTEERLSFMAEFGTYSNAGEAEKFLSILEAVTDTVGLNCCRLQKQKTKENTGTTVIIYKPVQFFGNHENKYQRFRIRYAIVSKWQSAESTNKWIVTLQMFRENQYALLD